MNKQYQGNLIMKVQWWLVVIALLFLFTNNAIAQNCTDTNPNAHFKVGSFPGAPLFRTPEEAGMQRCPLHGVVFSRAVKDNSPSPYSWGNLFCNGGGREYGVGHMFIGCCGINEVIFEGVCRTLDGDANKNDGSNCNLTSHPCNVASGNKFRSEVDIFPGVMGFTRFYNSRNLVDIGLGKGWRHNYQKKLTVIGNSLLLISRTGKGEPFVKTGGVWLGDDDSDYRLVETVSGYEVTRSNNAKENYNIFGQIVSQLSPANEKMTYEYGRSGLLAKVTNHYGQSLAFEYSGVLLSSITSFDGRKYLYLYDANRNLSELIQPDNTPLDGSDNPRKIYHYENINFPNHLTGITDENGDRSANFAYDENGKAVLSELGTTVNTFGQEKIELNYQGTNQHECNKY